VEQYGGNEAVAATIVAPPGTSEHQTGLCCDIADQFYSVKDSSLEDTALFKWMNEHCAEYGFILRYPKDKEDVTGIIYEPWHFRYVGVEAAQYMKENNLCLEEFVLLYQ
jgi:LAS superfamily LD-carboxypeptidase LdcB